MSPDNINQIPLSGDPVSSEPNKGTGDDEWMDPSLEGGGTTWQIPQSEPATVASGSFDPTLTSWSLLANFLSGRLPIDLRFFSKILIMLIMVGTIAFTGIIYYRDNELGRLQDIVGLQQFQMKAISVALYSLVLISFILIILWISAIIDRRKQIKGD